MKSGVEIIRYGELAASGFALGPWGEGTASAKGCLPLLKGNPFVTDETPVFAAISVKGNEAAHVFLFPDRLQVTGCRGAGASNLNHEDTKAQRGELGMGSWE